MRVFTIIPQMMNDCRQKCLSIFAFINMILWYSFSGNYIVYIAALEFKKLWNRNYQLSIINYQVPKSICDIAQIPMPCGL